MHERNDITTTVLAVADGVELVVGRVDARTPDVGLVDLLMRTQLAARRRGWQIRLRDVPPELRALLELIGLADVLDLPGSGAGSGLEAGRQPERGEQLGVDEVVQRPDPSG